MIQTMALISRDPNLRLAALALVLIGIGISSAMPFQSLVAVEVLGFSDLAYAAILVTEAVLAVTGAVLGGVLSDSWFDRRSLAIGSAMLAVIGSALMALAPGSLAYVLAHALFYPLSGALFSQTFALTRLATEGMDPEERDAVLSAVRAFLAVPFVIVLPIWSIVMAQGAELLVVYKAVFAVHIALFALTVTSWPSDKSAGWQTEKSRLSVMQGVRELSRGWVMARVLLMGAILGGTPVYMAVTGLIFADTVRTALYFGLVAGLEIPVMLWMGTLLKRFRRRHLIAGGAVAYGTAQVLFPALSETWAVWILVVPMALGGGVILSLPIAYLQDLLADRPGAGGSLIAVQRVMSQGIAAFVFVLGTAVAGYALVSVLAGLGVALAAAVYLWVERDTPSFQT